MNEPTLTVDPSSAIPVRRQILDQLRALVVEGTLRAGDELPSVRRLAIDLGIHFNTVAEAYRMLSDEGWIDISHGRGARVRERDEPSPPPAATVDQFRRRLRHLVAEMRSIGISPTKIARELFSAAEAMK